MMGFYSLYRLLWRPVLLALYVLLAGIFLLVASFPDREFLFLIQSGRLNLIMMGLPAIAGLFVGQSVGEIQHTPLPWTLPGLRGRLHSAVYLTGIGAAGLTTGIYDWLGGSAPLIPILTSCFLWYSLAFTAGSYEFIDARSLQIRKSADLFIAILIVIAGVASVNRIAHLYTAQPVLSAVVTLIGGIFYLRRSFSVKSGREKSSVPMPVFHGFTPGPYARAKWAERWNFMQKWNRAAPLTGLGDWVRAGEYENYGTARIGRLAHAILYSVVMLVVVAVMAWLFEQDSVVEVVLIPISMGLVNLQLSLYLKKGWVYPLSRPQLARLAYWSSLIHNAFYCGPLILGFLLLEGLAGIFAGIDLARPALFMFMCNPVIQWVRFRNEQFKVSSYVILALLLIGYSILIPIWIDLGPRAFIGYEVGAVIALILVSQFLFRYKIEKYFRTADLV